MMQQGVQVSPALWSLKWLAAGIAAIWMTIPAAIHTLLIMMLLDYSTGFIVAVMNRKLNAAEGLRGLGRKTLTLILVVTVHWVTEPLHLGLDVASMVAVAFTLNEMISITENCAHAGVPIPPQLLDVLLRGKKMTGRGVSEAEVRKDLD